MNIIVSAVDTSPGSPSASRRWRGAAAEGGQEYTARLATQLGFLNFRLPFNAFRYTSGGDGPAPPGPRQAHQPRHPVRARAKTGPLHRHARATGRTSCAAPAAGRPDL